MCMTFCVCTCAGLPCLVMPRRKQSQPQANLGTVESRAEDEVPFEPQQEQGSGESDADVPIRARKRRRQQPRPHTMPLPTRLEVHRGAPAGCQLWQVALLPLDQHGPGVQPRPAGEPPVAGRSCWLALHLSQAQSAELQDVDESPCGTLKTPDEEVGDSSSIAADWQQCLACCHSSSCSEPVVDKPLQCILLHMQLRC